MWRWAAAASVLVAAAIAAASARPAERSATAFSRCQDLVEGGQTATAPDGTLVYTSGYYVHSVRLDGTHDRTLYSADAPVTSPSVSRDGTLIAFDKGAASHEIWLMNSDGSGAHFVASGSTPAFAPDGTHLAIGGSATGGEATAALDVIGIDGTGRRTVATDAIPSPDPAWSPDGTKILFASYVFGMFTGSMVKVVDADGSDERDLAPGAFANFSPDGSKVAFTQFNVEAASQVAVINADRTGVHDLTPLSHQFDSLSPTWSPDGKKLTYYVAPTAYPQDADGLLWQIDATGRGRHPLAPDCRFGTGAADRIRGTSRTDKIYALEGNDTIDVRRGGRDFVDCGPGRDVVRADRRDVVARNCERRRR